MLYRRDVRMFDQRKKRVKGERKKKGFWDGIFYGLEAYEGNANGNLGLERHFEWIGEQAPVVLGTRAPKEVAFTGLA